MNFVAPLSQRFENGGTMAPPGGGRGTQPELPAESPGSCGSCRDPTAGATGRCLAWQDGGEPLVMSK